MTDNDSQEPNEGMSFLSFAEQVILVLEEDEEATEEARKQERRDHCGWKLGRYFDPETGDRRTCPFFCDLWRDKFCPFCFDRRKETFLTQISSASYLAEEEDRPIRFIKADERTSKYLVRKLDKAEYRRFPLPDCDVFFVDSDKVSLGRELTGDQILDLDWDSFTNTPEGKRTSGKLGLATKKKEEVKTDTVLVKVPVFILSPETTKEQEAVALEAALKLTKDLLPETPEEVEVALLKRTKAFVKALGKAGGSLMLESRIHIRIMPCRLARISWKRKYEQSNSQESSQSQETENLKQKSLLFA